MNANGVLKSKVALAIVILLLGITPAFAQIHNEEDGFQWIEFGEGIKTGAKSMNGNIIVEPKCDFVRYQTAKDGNVSIGYFYLVKYKDTELNAICDIKGKVIIPFKYNYADMGVKMCDSDTLIYFYTTNNNFKTSNIYDCTGRKIANEIPQFYIDDNGYICDFDNKRSLNIKIPSANGKLSNFYQKTPTEKVQTPLGWYAIQEKKDEGFNWHLLYTSSLCGAQTVDGKTIVPVEKKCKEINYDNGVFIAKTIDNVYCAYSKDGKELVSTLYNYYDIRVDGYTKTFLCCATKDGNDKYASLHDLNGKLIFPTGIYSDITPKKVNTKIYFIVSKDRKSQVLDYDHDLLISIDNPCFVCDIYGDKLGIYYKILQHDIKRNVGIVDEKGKVVIAPGRYDLIKRVVNDRVAFYETTIIKGDKYSDQEFLHGVCDLEGHEVLPNEYDYCPYSTTDIFQMKKGDITYEFNIAQLIADAKTQRDRPLAYAQDFAERSDVNQAKSGQGSQQQTNITSSSPNTINSKYAALNDPNLVDNSEKIAGAHQLINDLESQKRNCSSCHGTGSVPTICTMCRGTGTIKMGYYTPQYFTCTWCQGTGKQKTQCMACYQTNMQISLAQSLLKTLQETHGMTKETLNTYIEIKAMEHKQNMEFQRAINEIAEPYLNSTRKSNSSNSSTSSSSKCSICNGTGIDPHAYYSGDPKPYVGGYTHSSGGKCIYCGKYEWHQHVYCPKCNANKYP